jgi:hypothetical protein
MIFLAIAIAQTGYNNRKDSIEIRMYYCRVYSLNALFKNDLGYGNKSPREIKEIALIDKCLLSWHGSISIVIIMFSKVDDE